MNAAAKALEHSGLFRGSIKGLHFSKEILGLVILVFALLVSALAIVYHKNEQRFYFSQLQSAKEQSRQLNLEWGQLLLERTSLATPSRIHKIAVKDLGMVLPKYKKTIIIHH
jgi:cell division protein FtsL